MNKPNREKLFSFAQSTRVLPKWFWKDRSWFEPLSEPPVGSGPYKIISYKSGQSVTYGLDENYWAADSPVNVGRNNSQASAVRLLVSDDTVMLEAFKAGEFDLRTENSAALGQSTYGANFDKGYIIKAKKRSTMRNQRRLKVLSSIFNLLCSRS